MVTCEYCNTGFVPHEYELVNGAAHIRCPVCTALIPLMQDDSGNVTLAKRTYMEPEGKQALWHLDHYEGPWEVAVDIGAYLGDFTIAVAEKGCDVVAYEPNRDNFDGLLRNIADVLRASAINAAVVGSPNGAWCISGQGNTAQVRRGSSSHFVGTIALKDILSSFKQIDLLKIDIEGGEHEIFAPGHRTELKPLLQRVRFLQVEIHPPDGSGGSSDEYSRAIDELIAFFAECGFKDEPCPIRVLYAGDFCSHNHEFKGGRPE